MKNKSLKPKEIRERLSKRHGKAYNRLIADKAGKSGAWVSRHISGTLKTREGRKIIARHCGMKTTEVFED